MLSRAFQLCKNTTARRCHPTVALGSRSGASIASLLSDDDNTSSSRTHLNQFQRRTFAGRKDRAATSFETRPPTKKQRKTYHRRQRKLQYEKDKHSIPNSKARVRKAEQREHNERLIEIALEEERLKGELGVYFDKVREIQSRIESTDKFQAMLQDGKTDPDEIKRAAREAAKKAAAKEGVHPPPLPSWVEDRRTYDWGDALVDDLMGNSADLTSTLSPSPVFMGGEYGRLRRKVERVLRLKHEERLLLGNGEFESVQRNLPAQGNNVLSDRLISDLIRSHRDANGKRTSPIGLAPSLELLFQDLKIPRSELAIYSYTSLLTVCKNPWEARKVNEMRQGDGVRTNEYFWSALVDVYARSGDYLGAENVLNDMLVETKREYEQEMSAHNDTNDRSKLIQPIAIPPLAAYTSFFSSCYKLVSRPDVHPSIKADASKRAWNRWKEMRIHSVPPDEMAYGALMRIFAAQGRAEKAVDLLEEIIAQMMMPVSTENVMNNKGALEEILRSDEEGDGDGWYDDKTGKRIHVKPTTLLFTSALKAVAKSHAIACKFSGGMSRKNRKRESVTAHHGRLARKIVILAEQAEVEQDDGFVSALMLCAATSGDSSTARAIYLASEVRRLDHLRTCGGKDHLKKLQGLIPEDDQLRIGQSDSNLAHARDGKSTPALKTIEEEIADNHKEYENREYGYDTRVLSTLLLAHANAMQPKGLGSMWGGRFNKGYLCENSLRYIESYNIPKMKNKAIQGIDSVEAGLTAEGWEAEVFDDDTKQLRKKNKFRLQQIADDGEGNRNDDMDPMFEGYDPDPDEVRNDHIPLLSGGEDESGDWLSRIPGDPQQDLQLGAGMSSVGTVTGGFEESEEELMTLEEKLARVRNDPGLTDDDAEFNKLFEDSMRQLANVNNSEDERTSMSTTDDDLEGLFDEDEFNKLMEDTMKGMDGIDDEEDEDLKSIPGVVTNDYKAFRAHVEAELREEGSNQEVAEEETRQLFDMIRTHYTDRIDIPDADFSESGEVHDYSSSLLSAGSDEGNIDMSSGRATSDLPSGSLSTSKHGDFMQPQMIMDPTYAHMNMAKETIYADDFLEMTSANSHQIHASSESTLATAEDASLRSTESKMSFDMTPQRERNVTLKERDHITELQELLPGLPMSRINKVSNEFAAVLGYPSVLKLALALRENMPDAFGPQCLTRKNLANAKHLYSEASSKKIVDIHLANAMLQVYANTGKIEPAMRFYETEFKNHEMTPTTHSDRVMMGMLIKRKRIDRALKLKSQIEEERRTLDLLSYGNLVEHFATQHQLGSALMLIKECKHIHGSPPGEKALKTVREICRRHGLEKKVGLDELIGRDPLEWLHKGKQLQKSKMMKGNSKVMYAMNRMLDI